MEDTVVATVDMTKTCRQQLETILSTEGAGTVAERLAAYVKAFPKALPVLVAMQGETQYVALNDVITGVRLVAEAGMNDSDPYFDGEVLHGAGSTLSGIEFGLKIQAALEEWTSKGILEKPTGDNTMILIIYGSNQFPSDSSGFDALTTQLQLEYPEAWAMSPGFNPFGGMVAYTNGLAPSDMQPDIQNLINTRLANNADLKNVVLIGYSWGGGMAYNISTWLDETHPEINLAASIYVDAVALGSMSAEVRLPVGTQSFLNIYQSKTGASEWFLNGTAIQPQTFVDIVQVDMDANADSETHTTIDEASVSAILEFIRQRIISLSSQS